MCLVQQGTECLLYTASYLICTVGLRSRQGRCEPHCVLKKMTPTRLNVCEKSTFTWTKGPGVELVSSTAMRSISLTHFKDWKGVVSSEPAIDTACNRCAFNSKGVGGEHSLCSFSAQSVTPRGPKFPACFKPFKSV